MGNQQTALSRLQSLLTWQLVRGIGEVQLLTRASYIMLALVPVLAGIWPSVRLVIDKHNETLKKTTSELQEISQRLSSEAEALKNLHLPDNLDRNSASHTIDEFVYQVSKLASTVNTKVSQLERFGTLSPWLPVSWTLAFFAALGVTFGHLVYQTQAPEVVRKNSRDEYVSRKRQSFREQPREEDLDEALSIVRKKWWELDSFFREEALLEARKWAVEKGYPTDFEYDMDHFFAYFREQVDEATLKVIRALSDYKNPSQSYADEIKRWQEDKEDKTSRSIYLTKTSKVFSKIHSLRAVLMQMLSHDKMYLLEIFANRARDALEEGSNEQSLIYASQSFFGEDYRRVSELKDAAKLDVIGEAAILEYNAAGQRRRPMIILSVCLYIGASIPIAILTYQQSVSVLRASGWL